MATEAVKIPFVEGSAPSTPSASRVVIYAKSDGLMYSKDDAGAETLMSAGSAGSVATDAIWDAAGDLAVGSGANTAAKLTLGATNGMALRRVAGAVAWQLPPGHELDYATLTSIVTITGANEGAATTVLASNSVSYDGTDVMIEVYMPQVYGPANIATDVIVILVDSVGPTIIGIIHDTRSETANRGVTSMYARIKYTPSAASHTFTVKAHRTTSDAGVGGGAGGSGNLVPGYIRVVKA